MDARPISERFVREIQLARIEPRPRHAHSGEIGCEPVALKRRTVVNAEIDVNPFHKAPLDDIPAFPQSFEEAKIYWNAHLKGTII